MESMPANRLTVGSVLMGLFLAFWRKYGPLLSRKTTAGAILSAIVGAIGVGVSAETMNTASTILAALGTIVGVALTLVGRQDVETRLAIARVSPPEPVEALAASHGIQAQGFLGPVAGSALKSLAAQIARDVATRVVLEMLARRTPADGAASPARFADFPAADVPADPKDAPRGGVIRREFEQEEERTF